jgi:deoxyribose-phosphate aldolase
MTPYTLHDIAKMIDHSLLQPTMTIDVLEQGICLARQYDVASVCIMPYYLKRCAELLAGSGVRPSTTIGFPHGGHATAVKLAEARQALDDGGIELDMVVNISRVLSGNWGDVRDEIGAIVDLTHGRGGKLKVIFENCYLQDEHKIRLCEICGEAGADWVKTSTGYGTGGATLDDLRLMRKHASPHVQVKAAGGVRDLDMALAVREIGATRFGCTRSVDILEECKRRLAVG